MVKKAKTPRAKKSSASSASASATAEAPQATGFDPVIFERPAPAAARVAPKSPAALILSALVFALGFAVSVFITDLPPGAEFILPRRHGFWLFKAAWLMLQKSWVSAWIGLALPIVMLGGAVVGVWAIWRYRPKFTGWTPTLTAWAGPLVAILAATLVVVSEMAWIRLSLFPFASMNAWELPVSFLVFGATIVLAVLGAKNWLSGEHSRALWQGGAVLAVGAGLWLFLHAHGIGAQLPMASAPGNTTYFVFTERKEGGVEVRRVDRQFDVFAGPDSEAPLRAIAQDPSDLRAVTACRVLADLALRRMDPASLRDALLMGSARGDLLSRALLLAHLNAAIPSPEAISALGALADEDAFRVGPMGALSLSRAYTHLDVKDKAQLWAGKVGDGVPPGMLTSAAGGALHPGKISGQLKGVSRARVGLYTRPSADAPYYLDAGALVASADTGADGKFSFAGLPAGRYYLAVAVGNLAPMSNLNLGGVKGDIVLDAKHASVALSAITTAPISARKPAPDDDANAE